MYFWKTKELANKIRANELTESEKKNYYLAGMVITFLSMFLMSAQPRSSMSFRIADTALMILISVIGINLTFKSNGGDAGKDYVTRIVVISLPITIKLLLLTLPIGVVIGIIVAMLSLQSYVEFSMTALSAFVQLLLFWRINIAIKYINT